jgi:simple sugar transport system ATP-binding protein
VLLAVQPTRGLDVGAIEFVHRQLVSQRDNGKAILLVSFELDEILDLSDRILVLYGGRIVGEFAGGTVDRSTLGLLMGGRSLDDRDRAAQAVA